MSNPVESPAVVQTGTTDQTSGSIEPDGGRGASDGGGPTGRRLRFAVFAGVFGLVAALAFVEAAVRLLIPVTDVAVYFWDPVVGARLAPDQSGRSIRPGAYQAQFRINAQGWNAAADYKIARPEDVTRVCVIGDSFVQALQVDPADNMTAVAERVMRTAHEQTRATQWYAFGHAGFGLSQYYLLLHHYVAFYRPDVVVVVLVANDVYESSPYLLTAPLVRSTLDIHDDGTVELLPAPRFVPPRGKRLIQSTALGRLLTAQYAIHQTGERGIENRNLAQLTRAAERNVLLRGGGMSLEDRFEASWRHVEQVLSLIRDRCRELDAVLLLAYIGDAKKLDALYEGRVYEPVAEQSDRYCMGAGIWEMGSLWFAPIAERLGIPYIDLGDAVAAHVQATGRRHDYANDDHYSEIGHEACGRALAAEVSRLLAARKP